MKKVLTLIGLLSIVLISCTKDKTPQPESYGNSDNTTNIVKSDSNKYKVILSNETNNQQQMSSYVDVWDSSRPNPYYLFGCSNNNPFYFLTNKMSDSVTVTSHYNNEFDINIYNNTNPTSIRVQYFINNQPFKDTTIVTSTSYQYILDVLYNTKSNSYTFKVFSTL